MYIQGRQNQGEVPPPQFSRKLNTTKGRVSSALQFKSLVSPPTWKNVPLSLILHICIILHIICKMIIFMFTIHLIPKWRIIVTWPLMPRFRAALPRSSRVTAILEFILFIHFIYFATYNLQCGKRKQIMTSIQDSVTLKVIRN